MQVTIWLEAVIVHAGRIIAMSRRHANYSTADKVAFLSSPRSWPGAPQAVEVIETHMSWVFLTDADVYKMKKPVRLPFLDFRTIGARFRNCNAEVTLNRRLAPGVYLGVERLAVSATGELEIGGRGEAVDYLVHMRRLPAERMLDRLIRGRRVRRADVIKAAEVLARFYASATPVAYGAERYRRRLMADVETNCRAMRNRQYGLPAGQVQRVAEVQMQFLTTESELVVNRARHGHIVEAHGDLRPEHICLVDPPVILDCLEFNREFRLLDPADELAFLSVECDMAGGGAIGRLFLDVYQKTLDDRPPARLMAFYRCFRACLRARLAIWHLEDDPHQVRRNWLRIGQRYLDRADEYARLFSAEKDH